MSIPKAPGKNMTPAVIPPGQARPRRMSAPSVLLTRRQSLPDITVKVRTRRGSLGDLELAPESWSRQTSADSRTSQRESLASTTLPSGRSSVGSPWSAGLADPISPTRSVSSTTSPKPLRKDHKRWSSRNLDNLQEIDDAVENVMVGTTENPWCSKLLKAHPVCHRVCYPSDYATRNRREIDESYSHGGHQGAVFAAVGGTEGTNFGLPVFSEAGFMLDPVDQTPWMDELVPNVLGLRVATHRKTSAMKFCHYVSLQELPNNVGAFEVRTLVRDLKRCDHVNVLNLMEAYEDASGLYFLYEHFPCCTLQAVFKTHAWSQEEIVNLVREICAATAFANSAHCGSLAHLGLSFCHVLLPESCMLGGSPKFAKVFGFGLMGVTQIDSIDRLCWSPECLERRRQVGASCNFWPRLETRTRAGSDSWSLGVLVNAVISRHLSMTTEKAIALKQWAFSLALDAMDPEAKSLLEGFLHFSAEKRLRAERALHHAWIRRRWRPLPNSDQVFMKLERFYGPTTSLPKQLFGRFLVPFLTAQHLQIISRSFYAMDLQGNGIISQKEIQFAAKKAGHSTMEANTVFQCICPEPSSSKDRYVSLLRFAECLAEEVIDGRSLRQAFESLDDDGSEEVSAEELFEALRQMNPAVTLQEVTAHIDSVELNVLKAQEKGTQDHAFDFQEFIELFPVRQRCVKAMQERMQSSRERAQTLSHGFKSSKDALLLWTQSLSTSLDNMLEIADHFMDHAWRNRTIEICKLLRKEILNADGIMKHPPVPTCSGEAEDRVGKAKSKQHARGFEGFLKALASHNVWDTLFADEVRTVKSSITSSMTSADVVDTLKMHDTATAAVRKLKEVLDKISVQFEEYDSFVEAYDLDEAPVAIVPLSGRALRVRPSAN